MSSSFYPKKRRTSAPPSASKPAPAAASAAMPEMPPVGAGAAQEPDYTKPLAEDVAQQLQRTFATEAWRQKANRKERAPVSRFEVYYVPSSEVMALRPKGKKTVKYDRIVGISKSYQYFALNAGAVAMRRHRCCCKACLPTAITPQARPRRVRLPSH